MQALTPYGQLFPYYGTLPGAIAGPNDGQDPVAAITVNTGLLAIANGFEYFAGLTMGTPLGFQPPAIALPTYATIGSGKTLKIAANSGGSGVARIQTLDALIGFTSELTTLPANDGDVVLLPQLGLYQYVGTINVVPWSSGLTIPALGCRVTTPDGSVWAASSVVSGSFPTATGVTTPTRASPTDGAVNWAQLLPSSPVQSAALTGAWVLQSLPLFTRASGNNGSAILAGQYVGDPNVSGAAWIALAPGNLGTYSSYPTPTPGTQITDGVLLQAVAFPGYWTHSLGGLMNVLYGIAGLNGLAKVPHLQLPMQNQADTSLAGTVGGTVPLAELPMARGSDTAIAGTQSGHIPLAELPMANTSDTAIAGTQSGQVVWAEQAPPAVYTSGFSGGFTGKSSAWANVTGCSVASVVLSGKPVMMVGLGDGENYPQYVGVYSAVGYNTTVEFRLNVTGPSNYNFPLGMVQTAIVGTNNMVYVPPGSLSCLFTAMAAGTYTFQLQYQFNVTGGTDGSAFAAVLNAGFAVYEL